MAYIHLTHTQFFSLYVHVWHEIVQTLDTLTMVNPQDILCQPGIQYRFYILFINPKH